MTRGRRECWGTRLRLFHSGSPHWLVLQQNACHVITLSVLSSISGLCSALTIKLCINFGVLHCLLAQLDPNHLLDPLYTTSQQFKTPPEPEYNIPKVLQSAVNVKLNLLNYPFTSHLILTIITHLCRKMCIYIGARCLRNSCILSVLILN